MIILQEDLPARTARVARNLHRRFDMVPSEDIQQELWCWILTHTDKLDEWESTDQLGKLGKALWHAGLNYCQKEKADIVGYKVDDNYYYTLNQIEHMLSELFSTIDVYDEQSRHGLRDNDAMLDVMLVFVDLPETDRHLLYNLLTSSEAAPCAALAEVYGMTEDAFNSRKRRIIKRLQRELGGERPTEHRKVMSNASAQVLTRKEYLGE